VPTYGGPAADAAFAALAALPFGELYLAVIAEGVDPETGEVTPVYLTTAPSLYTEAADDPPTVGFRNVVLQDWTLARGIVEPGTFLGRSEFNTGRIAFDDLDGALAHLLDLDFADREFVALVGGRVQADGSPYPFSLYRPVLVGTSEELVRADSGGLELVVSGRSKRFEQPVVEQFYRGFGGGVRCHADAEAGESLSVTDTADWLKLPVVTGGMEFFGGLAVEWFGVIDALPAVEGTFLRRGEDYGLLVDPAGLLGWLGGGTPTWSSYVLPVGEPLWVAGNWRTPSELDLWAGRTALDAEIVATIAPAGGLFADSGLSVVLGTRGGNGFGFTVWEARVWNTWMPDEDLVDGMEQPLPLNLDDDRLAEAWRFSDGTGSLALGELGRLDLAISGAFDPDAGGGPTWESSLEGDDPGLFGDAGVVGESKPDVYGEGINVRAVPVDGQRHDHQWSLRPSADLRRLYVRAAPMVPDEQLVVAGGGDIALDGATDKIVLQPPHSAHRFVPGQTSPEVPGQKIEIANAGGLDGIYRIKAEGVAADGLSVAVEAADFSGAAGLPTANLPAAAIVRTPADEIQYAYDLARSTARLTSPAEGELTADVLGYLADHDEALASDVFQMLTGVAPDTTELLWDPLVGIAIASGDRVTLVEVLDKLAASFAGWWVEDFAGSYRIGTHRLPEGTPRATIAGSPIHTLDPSLIAPVTGRIHSIKERPAVIPRWQTTAGYRPNGTVQGGDSVVGSVPAARRRVLAEPFLRRPKPYPSVRRRYGGKSEPAEVVETYLLSQADADRWNELVAPLYTEQRRWFTVEIVGLAPLALDLPDVIVLQHPRPALGISGGILARVMRLEAATAGGIVEAEVFA
jgi:hypothetical protein